MGNKDYHCTNLLYHTDTFVMVFTDINYLRSGNKRQKLAYATLTEHSIIERLSSYDAVLAGTVPLGIDIAGSDLDILCRCGDPGEFGKVLRREFGRYPGFGLRRMTCNGLETVVASFMAGDFEIEVFGQDRSVTEQNAYRHMVAEHRILTREGEEFREKIINLKKQGIKTEPAFAMLLGLEGDPYEAMLKADI